MKGNNRIGTSDRCIGGCGIEIFFEYNEKNHISCDIGETLIICCCCWGIKVLFNALRNRNFFSKGPLIRERLKIRSGVYNSISWVSISICMILSKRVAFRFNNTIKHIEGR